MAAGGAPAAIAECLQNIGSGAVPLHEIPVR